METIGIMFVIVIYVAIAICLSMVKEKGRK